MPGNISPRGDPQQPTPALDLRLSARDPEFLHNAGRKIERSVPWLTR
jgi:hypothetical protein